MAVDSPAVRILVVEDSRTQALRLRRFLEEFGFHPIEAANGRLALEEMDREAPDLVLTDLEMPELDGIELLRIMKEDPARRDIPVLVLSSLQDTDRAVACIERGAEDYLPKPVDPVLLKARVSSCLSRKMLRDREKDYLQLLEYERQRSERLLYNVLPRSIAERLKRSPGVIADALPDVSVLFADLVGFTRFSASRPADEVVHFLSTLMSTFDRLADERGVEKIKALGDGWMGIAGLPGGRSDYAVATAELALAMRDHVADCRAKDGSRLQVRLGIASGPVVAGVIGETKLTFDIWGDTVNLASRMESTGLPDAIQVCPRTHTHLEHLFELEARGTVEVKGRGKMQTYLLRGARAGASSPVARPRRGEAEAAPLAPFEPRATANVIDPATDLPTLRGVMPLAEQQLGLAKRNHRALLLLRAELSPAQEADDAAAALSPQLLHAMADVFRAAFRESDVVGHLGDGRFVMVGVETSAADPKVLVEKLESAVARHSGDAVQVRANAQRLIPEADTNVEQLMDRLIAGRLDAPASRSRRVEKERR